MPDAPTEELVSSVTVAVSRGVPKGELRAMLEELVRSAGAHWPVGQRRGSARSVPRLIVCSGRVRGRRLAGRQAEA